MVADVMQFIDVEHLTCQGWLPFMASSDHCVCLFKRKPGSGLKPM